ncbi:MAG: glycerol-3-phosphate 1-O-acyltransferase PlsY [Endomicrobium sp.]|jgi:glycerol-3-phosphate acyltransferase PlsY|nr:glycerol-3-phosphate 1-O-acyltransferase PlsY [Endomicrobium sp.]
MVLKIGYIILAYLCGAIPFAYIIAKIAGKVDIRTVGSGNPGATNVFRSVGAGAGSVTFILDALKGFFPVWFAILIDSSFSYSVAVATAAMVGHIYTVFLKFKGGKGVATGCGVFLALMPIPTLCALFVFAAVFLISGYVALGSVCAAIVMPLASYFSGYHIEAVIFAFAVALLIIYKHRTNIKRLREGTENRFKIFKKKGN